LPDIFSGYPHLGKPFQLFSAMPESSYHPALRIILICFLFGFISVLFPYLPGHESDQSLWIRWSRHINTMGLRHAYASGTDYLPFYQYIMWIYGKLVHNPDAIGLRIGYLRCFTLLFDFLGLWYAYLWLNRIPDFLFLLLCSILNLSYSYNTVIWGQVDGIMSTMIFISLYYGYRKKIILSSIWFILALNMKLQSVVFLPLWGLLCLFALIDKKSWKDFFYALFAMAAIQLLLLLPFMTQKDGLSSIWNAAIGSVGRYPKVSMNAFNFWHLSMRQDPWDVLDETSWLGSLTYKRMGFMLFFAFSLAALWPLIRVVWQKIRRKDSTISRQQVWLTGSLLAILFFFFNTEMHERYCHPAFLFITAYSFYTRRFLPYVLFSLAYFLNLEKVLRFLKLENYQTLVFDPRFVAVLFLALLIYLFFRLYRPVRQTNTGLQS
jgi:Gpi18-like mannosyltransferase